MEPKKVTRRDFINTASVAGIAAAAGISGDALAAERDHKKRNICIFTKHLQWMDFDEAADTAAEIGFDGVDIPVRPGGHILPENAVEELPRATEAFRKAGLEVCMITTGINGVDSPHAEDTLKTMRDLDIPYYRTGYLHFGKEKSIKDSLEEFRPRLKELADMNRQYGVHGAYQNHSGPYFGAPIWDLWYVIKDLDPRWIGCQYDIRHNTVEGGKSWPMTLELLSPYIKTTVIKDFKWGIVDGKWEIINTLMDEGMVDFGAYYAEVKRHGIQGPISFHHEYPHERKRSVVTPLFKHDLLSLRAHLKQAGLLET